MSGILLAENDVNGWDIPVLAAREEPSVVWLCVTCDCECCESLAVSV